MMENPLGLPHSHTPPHTPISPPTFSRSREKIFFRLFEPKALGGHILSIYFFYLFTCHYSLSERRLQGPSDRLFSQAHVTPGMAFLSLLFLPVGLMLRQQIPRLIDEVKKLLRQVPLQHIVTGKVIDHNDYTVKTPIYGEYKLINYSD